MHVGGPPPSRPATLADERAELQETKSAVSHESKRFYAMCYGRVTLLLQHIVSRGMRRICASAVASECRAS